MPRNGSQNTSQRIVNELVRDATANAICGSAAYLKGRKAPPLTASLFESHIANVGPVEAASSVLAALQRAA